MLPESLSRDALTQLVQAVIDHELPLARAVDTIVTHLRPPMPPHPVRALLCRQEITLLIELAVAQQCQVWVAVQGILAVQRRRAEEAGAP